jgi:hypothetical protein
MRNIIVDIIKYTNENFPGWVRCKLIDAFGKVHYFNEKVPVVSFEDITKNTILPKTGYISGEIINEKGDIIFISTDKPYGIESEEGINKFYVNNNQVEDNTK